MTAVERPGSQSAGETPRSRLAAELRSAYESGARVRDLAVVSHRAQSEVRRLLREAGAVLGGGSRRRSARGFGPAVVVGAEGPLPGVPVGAGGNARVVPPVPAASAVGRRRRVGARVVRVGADTCFAVVPEWRSAIAVPVATEVLLAGTGLPYGELLGAELTVLVRPEALHDRELAAGDWRPAAADQSRGSGL